MEGKGSDLGGQFGQTLKKLLLGFQIGIFQFRAWNDVWLGKIVLKEIRNNSNTLIWEEDSRKWRNFRESWSRG